MKKKFLLPDIKEDLTTSESPGVWFDFNENFKKLDSLITLNKQASNVSSIPSPWAQLILFRDALDPNHPLHDKIISELLDVLEIIFFQESLSLNLSIVPFDLIESKSHFSNILIKLNIHDEINDDFLKNFKFLFAIDPYNNDKTYLIAGLSPYSILFTPKDKPLGIKRYFSFVTPFYQRPQLFLNYLVKLTENISKEANLKNSLNKLLEVFSNIANEIKNSNAYKTTLQNEINNYAELYYSFWGIELYYYKYNYVESPLKINSNKAKTNQPIIIKSDYNGVYYNNYNKTFTADLSEFRNLDRSVLPGEIVRYPWLIPEFDFLEDKLISLPYRFNDDILVLGRNRVRYKNYILPIKSEFFNYFNINDIDDFFVIKEVGNNLIEVELSIPIIGNNSPLKIKKVYTGQDIIPVEEPESVPLFILWPNIHPDLWSHPYYLATFYSNTKNNSNINIKFFDFDGKIIENIKSAEKSNSQTSFKLEKLPTIIEINKDGHSGLFVVDLNALNKPSIHEEAIVGIDFGTSNTNVAYKIGKEGETKLLTVINDAENNLYSFNYRDFIILNEAKYGNNQDSFDTKINKFSDSLKFFSQPQFIDEIFDLRENKAQIPFSSLIQFDSNSEHKVSLIDANIPFYLYFDKQQELQSDLKWRTDDKSRELVKLFLDQILLLVKYILLIKGVNPDNTKILWAYPKSFSKDQLDQLSKSWDSFMKQTRYFNIENLGKKDESQAGLHFFIKEHNLSDVHDQNSICIDVGGGTSDISINYKNENLLFASTFFGGNNLIGWENNGSKSLLLDFIEIKAKKQELRTAFSELDLENVRSFYNINKNHIKFNYIVRHLRSDYLNDVFQENTVSEKLIILYFFSILFYQVGIFLKYLSNVENRKISKKLKFYFGGNGSRFLDWLEYGSWESNSNSAEFFKSIFNKASTETNFSEIELEIEKSYSPKSEVAIGLCHSMDKRYKFVDSNNNIDQTLGESISYKGKIYESSYELQKVFGHSTYNDDTNIIDYQSIELSEDEPELIKFHKLFFSELKKSSVIEFKDEKTNKIFKRLNERLTDKKNLDGYIRHNLRKIYFDNNFGTIKTSLFILGAKGCLNEFINTFINKNYE